MKTVSRVLIISAVFLIFSGLMVLGDNFLSMIPGLDRPNRGPQVFVPNNGITANSQFESSERGGNDDRGRLNPSFRNIRWVLSVMKNIFIMGVFVALIVFPKSLIRKRKRQLVI
jgi:hypothetical protein